MEPLERTATWEKGEAPGDFSFRTIMWKAAMAPETSKQKRHFDTTPEPRPRLGKAHVCLFLWCRKHHASRLHYDFRLEADGVLKSWAVPKQPSLESGDQTSGQAGGGSLLEYANFSGEIPAGQYGAGLRTSGTRAHTRIYRRVSRTPRALLKASTPDTLRCNRMAVGSKGNFALIRMSKGGQKRPGC